MHGFVDNCRICHVRLPVIDIREQSLLTLLLIY